MIRLKKPDLDTTTVYEACLSGVTDSALAERFKTGAVEVEAIAVQYEKKAAAQHLYTLQASAWGKGGQQVLAGLTKDEFTVLYSEHMVGRKKPGRTYYDQLMMLAPLGKCPFCGFGHASTLDHFLSKSRYPAFSVLPINLIPSCTDCNKGKTASVITQKNQIPHPYFESDAIETDTWLFADVIESAPPTVRYFIKPPIGWPADLIQRVTIYFQDFGLASRFAVEAASELTSICDILTVLETAEVRGTHLKLISNVERGNRKNSWKAALCEALANSAWFLAHGYRRQTS